jgi:hypothetical protein
MTELPKYFYKGETVQAFLVGARDGRWLFDKAAPRTYEVKVPEEFLVNHPAPVGGYLLTGETGHAWAPKAEFEAEALGKGALREVTTLFGEGNPRWVEKMLTLVRSAGFPACRLEAGKAFDEIYIQIKLPGGEGKEAYRVSVEEVREMGAEAFVARALEAVVSTARGMPTASDDDFDDVVLGAPACNLGEGCESCQ